MKGQYLKELVRKIKAIDPRIYTKPIKKGESFRGPSKFLKIENEGNNRLVAYFYEKGDPDTDQGKKVSRQLDRRHYKLVVRRLEFFIGQDNEHIVCNARKAFELLLQR